MVWPDSEGGPTPIGNEVATITIEGRDYDVRKGAGPGGTDVVSYVDAATTTTLDIALAPFLEDSVSRGATGADSYVTSVQFGFEPWKGGAGLAVDDFTYSPSAERPVTTIPVPPTDEEDQPPADDQGEGGSGGGDQDQDGQQAAATAGGTALVGAGSGRCADVAGRSSEPGAPVQLWDCQGSNPAQQWARTQGDTVVNAGSHLCLDVAQGSTAKGAHVQQWTCRSGAPGQQWRTGPGGAVVNPASGLCLDAKGGGADNATRLILWECEEGADNQSWTLR